MERTGLGVDEFAKALPDDVSLSGSSCDSVILCMTGNDEAAAW